MTRRAVGLCKRLKVWTFICCRLQGNQNGDGLQFKVAYWPALAVGSTVQLAAAHCPNEQTHLFPSQLFKSCFNKFQHFAFGDGPKPGLTEEKLADWMLCSGQNMVTVTCWQCFISHLHHRRFTVMDCDVLLLPVSVDNVRWYSLWDKFLFTFITAFIFVQC